MGSSADQMVTSCTFGAVDAEPEDSGLVQVGAQPVELDEQTLSDDICLELRPMFAWAGQWPPPQPLCVSRFVGGIFPAWRRRRRTWFGTVMCNMTSFITAKTRPSGTWRMHTTPLSE